MKSTLAWILIHRDGPAIQPGSRSYERSWIRDGALTSTALLRLGHEPEVREFLAWYAPHQYPDGKVPCCVDARGADPVPENDSHGELLYLIAEHYRYTRDRAFTERLWPHVEKAVGYIDSLRRQRRTEEYHQPGKRAFYGLLPESISHEGYSEQAGPLLLGRLLGAARAQGRRRAGGGARPSGRAGPLDRDPRRVPRRPAGLPAADDRRSRHRLHPRLGRARRLRRHLHDHRPGPGGGARRPAARELRRTFERYWEEFVARRDGRKEWEAYTPYELRSVGTFVRLGWRERAHELLDFFLADRRPRAWNQWPEVVWRDPRAPKFLGDLPHGWVGSDFLRSFLDLFALEEEDALVVGAGVPDSWLAGEGVAVRGLRTKWGTLDCAMREDGGGVRVSLGGNLQVPPGGIVIRLAGVERVVRELPANIQAERNRR